MPSEADPLLVCGVVSNASALDSALAKWAAMCNNNLFGKSPYSAAKASPASRHKQQRASLIVSSLSKLAACNLKRVGNPAR